MTAWAALMLWPDIISTSVWLTYTGIYVIGRRSDSRLFSSEKMHQGDWGVLSSNLRSDLAVRVRKRFSGQAVGCHVYESDVGIMSGNVVSGFIEACRQHSMGAIQDASTAGQARSCVSTWLESRPQASSHSEGGIHLLIAPQGTLKIDD